MSSIFGSHKQMETTQGTVGYYSLPQLEREGVIKLDELPYSIRVMLEAIVRNHDNRIIRQDDVVALGQWSADSQGKREIAHHPARVILQDFTGVPAVVDLAALRSAMHRLDGDPQRINPQIPVDLVIDHSVQVDQFGHPDAIHENSRLEFERNNERYEFLRWGQKAFHNFRVVPPATGIVHQINLEFLANVVQTRRTDSDMIALPDSLVGTDSHTTMINGLGVVGWGVGGIEAEAVMLGQPIYMLTPEVIGVNLTGRLPEGTTATDLVLLVTQKLRQYGVVGKFVEFFGEGASHLSLADRATIANMAPEYGATMGFFPVDQETLNYLNGSGRDPEYVRFVEQYLKEQGMFLTNDAPVPRFTDTLSINLAEVVPALSGPKRPQDRIALSDMKSTFRKALQAPIAERGFALSDEQLSNQGDLDGTPMGHGSVIIAAITSCTNTSNPSVLIGAGLVARKAVAKGLKVPPFVKTSLAPGSRVVESYLKESGLLEDLEQLGFHIVGYGCTTCIGNSGPVPENVAQVVQDADLVASAVLSGNRNFEGRVNPLTKANYLASPPLVVAYALAGTTDIDLDNEPVGKGTGGKDVFLRDIWPTQAEIQQELNQALKPETFRARYKNVFESNDTWNRIQVSGGSVYDWDPESTYVREPSFFQDLTPKPEPINPVNNARVLALLGDSVTTDHISPAGNIIPDGPAGRYLQEHGIERKDFNSFGSRRGNHEVMMRGTFANIRLKNKMVAPKEGGYTLYQPAGDEMSIYDAAMKYQEAGTPLVILAGRDYGMGSSRDWAAKGTFLLGVKVVIAQSFERIHRSNLIGMGVIPLQFFNDQSADSFGFTGEEVFDFPGLNDQLEPGQTLEVIAHRPDGSEVKFRVLVRIDTPVEVDYYRNGGILQTVLRTMMD